MVFSCFCNLFYQVNDFFLADEDKDENLCAFYDEDDCRFSYVYAWDETGKIVVRALEQRECPPQVYILGECLSARVLAEVLLFCVITGIVLGVIGAIVLIGLALLLLWKLLTTIHDRREFAKFENERMMAKWDTVSYLFII